MNGPDYRLFYANAFKLRISPADIAVTFGIMAESPTDPAQQIVLDEATVMLALPQFFALTKQLHSLANALQKELAEIGAIPTAINWSDGDDSARLMVENLVSNLKKMQQSNLSPTS